MSIITWPGLKVSTFRWTRVDQAVVFRSQFGAQSAGIGSPLWEAELVGVPEYWAQAHQISAFLESIGGYANQVELWNLANPIPTGTMRGSMTLAADAAKGATSIQVTAGAGQAGKTLKKGDLLGLGSGTTQQVIRVMADATADGSGNITVTISPALRNAFSTGASVTWDKPKALFRQKSLASGIEFGAVVGQPWALSLVEDWRP